MAEYYIGGVSSAANSAELWRKGEGGAPDERMMLNSLGTAGTNRTLNFEISGDTVIVTDGFDPSYRLVFNAAGTTHGDQLDPL